MNFLEVFEELTVLNEEVLTEKLWVAIQPKGSDTWYRFYTVNDKNDRNTDIADLLGDRNGTYKQTLDRDVLADLKKELKTAMDNEKTNSLSDPANYTLKSPSEVDQAKLRTLTLTDRVLRQDAQAKYNTDILEKNNKLKELMNNKKCLIHHINGHEDETTSQNVVLVPYLADNKAELKVANGIHSILHVTADKHNVKKVPINWGTPIYYFDDSGDLKIGSCNIVIDLSKAPEGYSNEN